MTNPNHCQHCNTDYDKPDVVEVCAECGEPEARERGNGDECLTVCEACRSIEGGYKDRDYCPNCCEAL